MRPTWDETWLAVAADVAKRAACTRSQVGAVVVTADNLFMWVGYNGAPSGETHCTDGGCPRGKLSYEELAAGTSYENCIALHAEMNALLRAGDRAKGATLYITRPACDWCAKIIRSAGIARVVTPEINQE